jgi:hypothetical protein
MANQLIIVTIVGARIACLQGVRDGWRDSAQWADRWLRERFGDVVCVRYFDLLEPDCPALPPDAKLPLVLIQGQAISCGGKLPMPAIRRQIEILLAASTDEG